MSIVGHVESLWRYPVKSMCGEKLQDAFIAFSGVYGDRLYAFHNPAALAGFPYLTGRELAEMLLYRPKFRHPEKAHRPPNLAEAESLAPGLTPVYPCPADLVVDVETPAGDVLAIDNPALHDRLRTGSGAADELTLLRSDRAMTDCRPVSLISTQTVSALGGQVGMALDQRRFRANIYVDLGAASGFTEDTFLGRSLQPSCPLARTRAGSSSARGDALSKRTCNSSRQIVRPTSVEGSADVRFGIWPSACSTSCEYRR